MTECATSITIRGERGGASKTVKICCTQVYSQTLFLGCSIKGFNASLGWGGEASRLTVELVYDNCNYPSLIDANGNEISPSTANDAYTRDRKNNTFRKDANGNSVIPAKVYYIPSGDKLVSKYWTGPDPGFYADMPEDKDSINIIGAAVYFKYDDFEFNGVVKSWENTGGSGGTKFYSVSIESPAFLLSQTQMILGDYHGAIFVNGISPNFPNHGFPAMSAGQYLGDISQQMIPNVINVYGYLEDTTNITQGLPLDPNGVPVYQYGASGRNDEGIQVSRVLNAIKDLLNSSEPLNKQKILRYAPFGRIIGIAPKMKNTHQKINFSSSKYSMGLIRPQLFPPSNKERTAYTLDIQDAIDNATLPKFYRLSDNRLSILEFLQNICDNTGQELFITLDLQIVDSVIYPRIKINTFSTLSQPPVGAVQSYIDELSEDGSIVASYSKGEEFNNSKPVRTMLIGGKQQRLYQVKNAKYAAKQSTLRYNPYTNTFMVIDHFGGAGQQQYRIPDPINTRWPSLYDDAETPSFSFGRVPLFDNMVDQTDVWGANIVRGNYYSAINANAIGTGGVSDIGSEYPSADSDAICPFFGVNDLTGVVRPVTFHYGKRPAGGGLGFLVSFTTSEIGAAIGRSFGSNMTVRVSETEIRAAMSGFDAYVGFIGAIVSELRGSGLDIWTKVLAPILGPNALRTMLQGASQTYNKFTNSQSGSNTVPINARSSVMTDPSLFEVLTKLQEYFKKIGDEFYGKKFMVSVPTQDKWYWTDSQEFIPAIQIGDSGTGQPIYLREGSQKTYYSFEPTDSAWEEPFNYIDDTLRVGSPAMDIFIREDGSIEPIVGYNNSAQYNYGKALNKMMFDWIKNRETNSELSEFWKFDAYRAAGIVAPGFNLWEPSLVLNDTKKHIVAYPYPLTDAFGQSIPQAYVSKVYAKATVDKQFYTHVTLAGNIVPKIIITTDPVFLNPMNPDAHSLQTAVAEFLYEDYYNSDPLLAARASKILSTSDKYISSTQYQNGSFDISNATLAQNKDNKQYNNLSIFPKTAVPGFAAIPLVFNTSCYGPWISAPDLIKDDIFGEDNMPDLQLENLVGGVNLEINSDLVPWNYGGMRVLDEAALLLVGQNNDYQTKGETGQLTVYGVPKFNLGEELKALTWEFRGPTINNIQVQISESGPSTTYTFRTFTRKFTLFNKDSADRLKNIGQNSIRLSREFRQQSRGIVDRLLSLSNTETVSAYDLTGSKLRAYSPMSILVGYSSPYVSPKTQNNPGFYNRPSWSGDSIRQLTTVTLQDTRELPQEFDHLFSAKSFMSLDGLLHPVSFYPTINSSTSAYKPYYRAGCPMCKGTKRYTFNIGNTTTTLWCDFCTETIAGTESSTGEAKQAKLPPFILSDQADDSIIKNPKALADLLSTQTTGKTINYVNLNPIIMPVGELRNKYAQINDFTAHHIDVVGRSLVPPAGSLSITDNLAINQNGLEYKDQNAADSDGDWNSAAFDASIERSPGFFQNNYRFLALRGPLVMAGWGFDVDGFPVPNASGEPQQVNNRGYPKKIRDKYDRQGGYADDGYEGHILGKNQTWDSAKNEWSAPTKEDTFYKGWGLRPDTWPVGPIDLRWDDKRKVWTASGGNNIQLVDIQLEDNLAPPFPARGFIYALDKESPLPSGLRRMVFVRDKSQTYGAPRGTKLLCYYDELSGFYEPVSKPSIIAYGEIQSSGVATIYDAYARGFDPNTDMPETPQPIRVEFENILNFSITTENQPGFFMFNKNTWILLNTNVCS